VVPAVKLNAFTLRIWTALFGETLLGQKGASLDTGSHLDGKHVLIYFSAHWCPPCRGFTPQLATFYTSFQQTTTKPFEIVFVSSDRDETSFNEYFGEMPWVALPFEKRDLKASLSGKYKVSGIPTLVVLDPQGNLITDKGRSVVSSDPQGKNFPWIPKTLMEALQGNLKTHSGEVSSESLKGKYFGLYFSAHWCPPCRAFTPKLAETYNKIKAAGKEFEIVFVSSDQKEKEFNEYFESMPWATLGFQDERADELSELCGVEGIPQLTLVSADGTIISNNGRSFVSEDPEGAEFPWYPKPLQKLSYAGDELNSEPCLIGLFREDDPNAQAHVDVLRDIAEAQVAAHKRGEVNQVHFFYSVGFAGLGERLVDFLQLNPDDSQVVLLNLPQNFATVEPNADAINTFLTAFHNKTADLKPIPRN